MIGKTETVYATREAAEAAAFTAEVRDCLDVMAGVTRNDDTLSYSTGDLNVKATFSYSTGTVEVTATDSAEITLDDDTETLRFTLRVAGRSDAWEVARCLRTVDWVWPDAETVTDPRIAIATAAVAALPAEAAALAVIDTTELPDPDSPAVVTVGDWYARVCYGDHDGRGGIGFVAYLGHDLHSAPTAEYAMSTVAMAAIVAAWINQPGPTYAVSCAIEDELRLLARRLHAIQDADCTAEQVTAEVRTLDPAAEVLASDPHGFEYPHLVTVHGHQLHLGYEAWERGEGRGWVWSWAKEADAA